MLNDMEALLSSAGPETEHLVGPLKFGLDPQGSYVQNRESTSTFSNVNSASPAGVKQITINVGSSSAWLDPQTVLLSMLITNTDTVNSLWPATVGSHCLFDSVTIRMGSTEVERIDQFGKLTEIMTKYSMSPQKRMEVGMLGFGTQVKASNPNMYMTDQHDARPIPPGGSKRIYMKFDLSGVFSTHRWTPLFALGGMGLGIQCALAPAASAMILSEGGVTYSSGYVLSDIRLLSDQFFYRVSSKKVLMPLC